MRLRPRHSVPMAYNYGACCADALPLGDTKLYKDVSLGRLNVTDGHYKPWEAKARGEVKI